MGDTKVFSFRTERFWVVNISRVRLDCCALKLKMMSLRSLNELWGIMYLKQEFLIGKITSPTAKY